MFNNRMVAQFVTTMQDNERQKEIRIVPRVTTRGNTELKLLPPPQPCAGLLLPRNTITPLPWERILQEADSPAPTIEDRQPLYEYDNRAWLAIPPRIRYQALTEDETLMDIQGQFLLGKMSEGDFLRAARTWADDMIELRRRHNRENPPAPPAAVAPPPPKFTPPVDRSEAIKSLTDNTFERLKQVQEAHHQAELDRVLQDAARLKTLLKDWLNIDCEPKSNQIKIGKFTYILTGRLGLGQKNMMTQGITIEVEAPYRGGKSVRNGMIYDLESAQRWLEWIRQKEADEAAKASAGQKVTYFGKGTKEARAAGPYVSNQGSTPQ